MQFCLRRPEFRRWIPSGEAPVPSYVKNFTANKLSDKILNIGVANIASQY